MFTRHNAAGESSDLAACVVIAAVSVAPVAVAFAAAAAASIAVVAAAAAPPGSPEAASASGCEQSPCAGWRGLQPTMGVMIGRTREGEG